MEGVGAPVDAEETDFEMVVILSLKPAEGWGMVAEFAAGWVMAEPWLALLQLRREVAHLGQYSQQPFSRPVPPDNQIPPS